MAINIAMLAGHVFDAKVGFPKLPEKANFCSLLKGM